MKTKLFSIIRVVLFVSVASLASNTAFAAGLTSLGAVNSLNSGTALQIRGGMTGNPDGCADTDAYILDGASTDYKNIYAGLLTAYAAGKDVQLFVDGCIDNVAMTKNRPEVKSIYLQ